jgi:phage-related protein
MARALVIEILGSAKQFGEELDRAAGKTRSLGKVAGVAGLAIAGGLAIGLEKSVKAAMEGQTATARLDSAFKQSGESADKYASQIDKAESSGRALGFTNLDVRDSLGSLEIATKSHTQAIKDLSVAEDIARFKHVDLATASKSLTMAMSGSQRAIKQLGLSIPPVTTHYDALKRSGEDLTTKTGMLDVAHAKLQDKMATSKAVIDAVTQKMHGQAAAFADTAAGGMAKFHAQSEAIQENLGQALLPAVQAVTEKIAAFTGFLSQHTTTAKIFVGVLGALSAILITTSVASSIAAAAATIAGAATTFWSAATWSLDAALAVLVSPIALVIAGIVALGVAIYEAVKHFDAIKHAATVAWDAIRSVVMSTVNFIVSNVPQKFDDLKNKITGALKEAKTWVTQHWPEIATLLSGPFALLVAPATNAFGIRDKFVAALHAMKDLADHIWDGLKAAWNDVWGGFAVVVVAPIKTIISWIKDLIGWIQDLIGWLGKIHIPGSSTASTHARGSTPGHHAEGGVFTRPTLGIIGEAGPEAVIPLSRLSRHMGSNVTVNVYGWVGSDQDLALKMRNEFIKIARREPNVLGGFA